MKWQIFAIVIVSIIGSTTFTGCKKEGCTDPEALNYDADAKKDDNSCIYQTTGCTDPLAENYNPDAVADDGSCTYSSNSLFFLMKHSVDAQDILFDQMIYQNAAGNNYSLVTLKYYVSYFVLHSTAGSDVLIDVEQYCDIHDSSTLYFAANNIPDGSYSGLSFVFGLDSTKNQTGYLPNTQVHNNMIWPDPMGGGYHHMKLEGKYTDTAGQVSSYNIHLGKANEISGNDTILRNNMVAVNLPNSAFIISNNAIEIVLEMNLNKWYTNPNVYDFNDFGQAIMGNQTAQQRIKENGIDVFTVNQVIIK